MQVQFDHTALSVSDIERSVAFYRSTFENIEILYQDDSWAFLAIGKSRIALVLEEQHPPHVAFALDSRELFHLEASNRGAVPKLHRDGSESFYLKDPDGNVLEVMFYPPSGAMP